ncbi:MAG: hypothetical protein AAF433_22960 [Bacteroidota bacterium]
MRLYFFTALLFLSAHLFSQTSIGDFHNHYLTEIINNIDVNEGNVVEQAEFFISNHPDFKGSNFDLDLFKQFDYESVVANFNTQEGVDYFSKLHSIAMNSTVYADLVRQVSILESEMNSSKTLPELESRALLFMADVQKSSASFWYPTSAGGSGVGYKLLVDYHGPPNTQARGWFANLIGNALAADGISAAGGMLGTAASLWTGWAAAAAASGPPGWTGFAVAVGFGSLVGALK